MLLRPMPAWECLGHVRILSAFGLTLLMMLFRPARFLRLLRVEEGLLRTCAFFVLLIPTAFVVAVILSITAAAVGYPFRSLVPNYDWWQANLIGPRFRLSHFAPNAMRVALHCGAFLGTIVAVWLPALAVMDLMLRRNRAPFRLFAKALLYSMTWACLAAAICSTLGRAILEQIDREWAWSPIGRSIRGGALPWVCWVALAVVTMQCATLTWFVGSPKCAYREAGDFAVGCAYGLIAATWLLAAYLLLGDYHVHLRFHLLFCNQELRPWQWFRGYH
ncbi:MAG: hypothetical protein CHACPFDD_00328 [Phycisphaerae bacterium]|nr:hypothetical protein [Phycisphaerae bacterium]